MAKKYFNEDNISTYNSGNLDPSYVIPELPNTPYYENKYKLGIINQKKQDVKDFLKDNSTLLIVMGILTLVGAGTPFAIFAIILLVKMSKNSRHGQPSTLQNLVFSFKYRHVMKNYIRYGQYLENTRSFSFAWLSHVSGISPIGIQNDFKKFVDIGLFTYENVDFVHGCVYLTEETIQSHYVEKDILDSTARDADVVHGGFIAADTTARTQVYDQEPVESHRFANGQYQGSFAGSGDSNASAASSDESEMYRQGQEFIRKIHMYNESIPYEDITNDLNQTEKLLKVLYKHIQESPEDEGKLSKINSYYLPQMLNLLETYTKIYRSNNTSQEALTIQTEIGNTLKTLNKGLTNISNGILQDTKMDVSADISVMEQMMHQDGFL